MISARWCVSNWVVRKAIWRIEPILRIVVGNGFPLPTALLAALTEWLGLYVGSSEERLLRDLVIRVRSLGPDFEAGIAFRLTCNQCWFGPAEA